MMPRLDETGQPQRLRTPNKETGKTVKEQRVSVETFSEFYITDKEEIKNFIGMFAVNTASFDYDQYFVDAEKTETSNIIMTP